MQYSYESVTKPAGGGTSALRGYTLVNKEQNPMINGAHIVVYSKDAEADRHFFRDVLGFRPWTLVTDG